MSHYFPNSFKQRERILDSYNKRERVPDSFNMREGVSDSYNKWERVADRYKQQERVSDSYNKWETVPDNYNNWERVLDSYNKQECVPDSLKDDISDVPRFFRKKDEPLFFPTVISSGKVLPIVISRREPVANS